MDYNKDKVDDMTLALLYLVMWKEDDYGYRAWKGFDWDTMNRLHEKNLISNPKSRAKSVALSDEGAQKARKLFKKYFQE